MANPIVKIGIAAAKAAAKAVTKKSKPSLKTAQKAPTLTTPKSGVKVKSTGKPGPEPFSRMKPSRPVSPIIGKPGFKKSIKINTDPIKNKPPKNKPQTRPGFMLDGSLKVVNKRINKMEDVPAGVSARFAATNARLAKEAAKKKKAK